jgi:hypothetical protein
LKLASVGRIICSILLSLSRWRCSLILIEAAYALRRGAGRVSLQPDAVSGPLHPRLTCASRARVLFGLPHRNRMEDCAGYGLDVSRAQCHGGDLGRKTRQKNCVASDHSTPRTVQRCRQTLAFLALDAYENLLPGTPRGSINHVDMIDDSMCPSEAARKASRGPRDASPLRARSTGVVYLTKCV